MQRVHRTTIIVALLVTTTFASPAEGHAPTTAETMAWVVCPGPFERVTWTPVHERGPAGADWAILIGIKLAGGSGFWHNTSVNATVFDATTQTASLKWNFFTVAWIRDEYVHENVFQGEIPNRLSMRISVSNDEGIAQCYAVFVSLALHV